MPTPLDLLKKTLSTSVLAAQLTNFCYCVLYNVIHIYFGCPGPNLDTAALVQFKFHLGFNIQASLSSQQELDFHAGSLQITLLSQTHQN